MCESGAQREGAVEIKVGGMQKGGVWSTLYKAWERTRLPAERVETAKRSGQRTELREPPAFRGQEKGRNIDVRYFL